MVAYGEFRAPFEKDKEDSRFVFWGIRYYVENYLNHKWTVEVLLILCDPPSSPFSSLFLIGC